MVKLDARNACLGAPSPTSSAKKYFGLETFLVPALDLRTQRLAARYSWPRNHNGENQEERNCRPGKELHHQNASGAKTADRSPRFPPTMYFQRHISARATEYQKSLQIRQPLHYLLLHEGHPVSPPRTSPCQISSTKSALQKDRPVTGAQ
jgi:hypothetical protein